MNLILSDGVKAVENRSLALALGFFDGVHIGHRAVIAAADEYAKGNNMDTAVFTFVNGKSKSCLIYDRQTKHEVFAECGVSICIEPDFNSFKHLEPEEFVVELLMKKFSAKALFCGWNFRFGKNRAGNTKILQELGEKYDLEVQVISQTKLNDNEVSSSIIRAMLHKGEIETANSMLCRPYTIKARALSADIKDGKTELLMEYSHNICSLQRGIYAANAIISGEVSNASVNICHKAMSDMDSCKGKRCIVELDKNVKVDEGNEAVLVFKRYLGQ